MSGLCQFGLSLLVILTFILRAAWAGQLPAAPTASQAPASMQAHGQTLVDPYPWMDNAHDPEMIAYLEAENRYTAAVMANTQELQEQLFREMRSRTDETDTQPPLRIGTDWYYLRTAPGAQFLVLCRRRGSLNGPEEVLLDLNRRADGRKKPDLGLWRISPNLKYLAYSVDDDGSENFSIHTQRIGCETPSQETISRAGRWIEWAADSQTLFYTAPAYGDPPPRRVMRHRVGSPPSQDAIVHSEPSGARLGLSRTRSGEFLVLFTYSYGGDIEFRVLAANEPLGSFRPVGPGGKVSRTWLEQGGRFFYMLVDGNENSRIIRRPVSTAAAANWVEVVPEVKDRDIESFDVAGDELILVVHHQLERRIVRWNLRTQAETDLKFSDLSASVTIPANLDRLFPAWPNNPVRLLSESFVNPGSVLEYDSKHKALKLVWQSHVPNYEPRDYEVRRVFAVASDGVQIPISLVFKKPLVRDGNRPLLIHVYGSMGFSVEPSFDAQRVSLLDRGVVFAVAHVRGGGELGRRWHEAAIGPTKLRSFTDLIAASEFLIAERYTSRAKLAITGHSAGGLLVTGAAAMRPDLFQAVIGKAPWVQLFFPATGRLVGMVDVGDPTDKAVFEAMRTYSPYDNVRAQDYPHLLITASQADARGGPSEAAKLVARLRAAHSGTNMLLLKVEMETGGHMGAAGRLDSMREAAFEYALLLEALRIPRGPR